MFSQTAVNGTPIRSFKAWFVTNGNSTNQDESFHRGSLGNRIMVSLEASTFTCAAADSKLLSVRERFVTL